LDSLILLTGKAARAALEFFPKIDFSSLQRLEEFAAVVKRDLEQKPDPPGSA